MENEAPKVIVEVPQGGNYSPVSSPQSLVPNKLEEFKRGWINAIALPDNPTDLVFDITTSITIPALVTSCWASFPIPGFLRIGGLIAIAILALVGWQMLNITEIRNYLIFRLILVTVGVVIGL
ncbi:hypothetical protein H6G36_02265 [Anabaena minutissima FACHB-250]|nr:hypothetical protein [Anabaena minutissima FACHB-250]